MTSKMMPFEDGTLASGVFKFGAGADRQTVANFVNNAWGTDERFLRLALRGSDGERRFGIDFVYSHGGSKEDFRAFQEMCIGKLKAAFPRHFDGWDLSSSTQIIKA